MQALRGCSGRVACGRTPLAGALPRQGLSRRHALLVRASVETQETKPKTEAELATEKMGLEAGLFKALTSKEQPGQPSRTQQAKELLTKYGSAYLITSISFAIVSFAACYFAVNAGVDMGSLLGGLGLEVNTTNESVGTFALAYAAHKALSPVRFPPTVALTPVVAKFLGKKSEVAQ